MGRWIDWSRVTALAMNAGKTKIQIEDGKNARTEADQIRRLMGEDGIAEACDTGYEKDGLDTGRLFGEFS